MQRLATQGSRVARPVVNAASGGAASSSHHHAQVREISEAETPNPTPLISMVDEDWDFIQNPVTNAEVTVALNDFANFSLNCRPVIRTMSRSEADVDSSDDDASEISEDLRASRYMVRAETAYESSFTLRHTSPHMEGISNIVANLLNDAVVGPAICNALMRDEEFNTLLHRHAYSLGGNAEGAFLLPGPDGAHIHETNGDNPVDAFIRGAVNFIVQAVCHLGNALRRLPEDLKMLFSSMGGQGPNHQEDRASEIKSALFRVATAAALVVITRRALIRLA